MVLMPNSLRSFWNASTLRGFVSRCASWSWVPQNSKLTTPSIARSLKKWNLIVMCLEQPCNTGFLDNLVVEELTHISFVPAAWTWPISFRILIIQIARQAHAAAAKKLNLCSWQVDDRLLSEWPRYCSSTHHKYITWSTLVISYVTSIVTITESDQLTSCSRL